jgi:hypothetical protein
MPGFSLELEADVGIRPAYADLQPAQQFSIFKHCGQLQARQLAAMLMQETRGRQ